VSIGNRTGIKPNERHTPWQARAEKLILRSMKLRRGDNIAFRNNFSPDKAIRPASGARFARRPRDRPTFFAPLQLKLSSADAHCKFRHRVASVTHLPLHLREQRRPNKFRDQN
jgi:hypothetical protein